MQVIKIKKAKTNIKLIPSKDLFKDIWPFSWILFFCTLWTMWSDMALITGDFTGFLTVGKTSSSSESLKPYFEKWSTYKTK